MCFGPKLSKICISRKEINNYDKNSNLQTREAATPAFQEAKDGLHVVVCVEPQPAQAYTGRGQKTRETLVSRHPPPKNTQKLKTTIFTVICEHRDGIFKL
jgi:hypothetical protein